MQYTVEDTSELKKKVTITVPAEDVDAVLKRLIENYRRNVTLRGFRKGKAPLGMVEKRFYSEIYGDAATRMVEEHMDTVVKETDLVPVSRVEFDGEAVERGKEYVFSLRFEAMPQFELPQYEGLLVEQETSEVSDEDVESVIERLRGRMADTVPAPDDRAAAEGDVAVVTFEGKLENGEIPPGVSGEGFEVSLGEGQVLPDFEKIIIGLKKGDSGEGPMSFPANYFNQELAGKTVAVTLTLTELKERRLPELNDEFAVNAGGLETMEQLRAGIRQSYERSRSDAHKAAAKEKLLDRMLENLEFPVPDVMLDMNLRIIAADKRDKMGWEPGAAGAADAGIEATQKSDDELREEVRPEALKRTRAQVLLLTVARKNNLTISDFEADMQLRRMAMQSGQDYKALREYYHSSNILPALKERLLEDKALDFIYGKATVTMVPPQKDDAALTEAGDASVEPQNGDGMPAEMKDGGDTPVATEAGDTPEKVKNR